MKVRPISELSKSFVPLVRQALAVRKRAYAPYSNYSVGCAIVDSAGKVHTGCNIENASYDSVVCAERVAIFKMITRGDRQIKTILLVASEKIPAFPCGNCLQVIAEFGPEAVVIAVNTKGTVFRQAKFKELYPHGFDRAQLSR